MDLRRLCCVGLCACGAAFVVLVVPSLRFILASQAGLVIGWRIAAMPPNILAGFPMAPALLQELLQSFTMDKIFEEGGELGTAIIN